MKRVYSLCNYLFASLFWEYKSLLSLSTCDRVPGTKYMIKYLSQETGQLLCSVLIEFKRESIWSPSFSVASDWLHNLLPATWFFFLTTRLYGSHWSGNPDRIGGRSSGLYLRCTIIAPHSIHPVIDFLKGLEKMKSESSPFVETSLGNYFVLVSSYWVITA